MGFLEMFEGSTVIAARSVITLFAVKSLALVFAIGIAIFISLRPAIAGDFFITSPVLVEAIV